jgi:hypothetical protein
VAPNRLLIGQKEIYFIVKLNFMALGKCICLLESRETRIIVKLNLML